MPHRFPSPSPSFALPFLRSLSLRGPMLFSPLSDMPSIGRNNVYIATLFIFILFSIPAAIAPNYSTLMVSVTWSIFRQPAGRLRNYRSKTRAFKMAIYSTMILSWHFHFSSPSRPSAPSHPYLHQACRFLTGFFGSPALAIGGASISDVWSGGSVAKG